MTITYMKQAVKPKSASAAPATKTGAKPDVLHQIANEVENLSRQKAFALADELIQERGQRHFTLGGVLAVIHDKCKAEGNAEWLEGHGSFKELCEKRFNFTYQTAWDLIVVYKHLVDKKIPGSIVDEIGWTKVFVLARAGLPKTAKDAATWVEKIQNGKLTVTQLKHLVKGAEASKTTTVTFKVHEDQKEAIGEMLKKGKHEFKTDVDTVALHNIAQMYLGNAIAMDVKCPHCGGAFTASGGN